MGPLDRLAAGDEVRFGAPIPRTLGVALRKYVLAWLEFHVSRKRTTKCHGRAASDTANPALLVAAPCDSHVAAFPPISAPRVSSYPELLYRSVFACFFSVTSDEQRMIHLGMLVVAFTALRACVNTVRIREKGGIRANKSNCDRTSCSNSVRHRD